MKNYYFYTHYFNLANFFSTGYIHAPTIAKSKYQYVSHGLHEEDDNLTFYMEDNLLFVQGSDIVAVNIGTNLKNIDSNNIQFIGEKGPVKHFRGAKKIKVKGLLPITFIKEIIFKNDVELSSFSQMKWGNTIKLNIDKLKVGPSLFEPKNKVPSLPFSNNTSNKADHRSYDVCNKELAKHYLIMNFIYNQNLFDHSLCDSLPADFKVYPERNDKTLEIARNIFYHSFKEDHLGYIKNEYFSEKDFHFWHAISKIIYSLDVDFSEENRKGNVIENSRKFSFKREVIEQIANNYKQKIDDDKDDLLLVFLRKLYSEFNNLDLVSAELLRDLDGEKNLGKDCCILVHSLARYGDDITNLKSILNERISGIESICDMIALIPLVMYVGVERLPESIKMPDNWRISNALFENDMVLAKPSFDKSRKIRIGRVTKRPNLSDYLVGDVIKIDKIKFRVEDRNVEKFPKEGKAVVSLKIKNNYSFIFNYKEDIPFKEVLDMDDLDSFLVWLKKQLNSMSDKNRKNEIIRDIYDNLTDDEKIYYGGFKKKRLYG